MFITKELCKYYQTVSSQIKEAKIIYQSEWSIMVKEKRIPVN